MNISGNTSCGWRRYLPAMLLLIASTAHADIPRIIDSTVGQTPELTFGFAAGQTIDFETRNLSSGADPVIHLWDLNLNVEVAMDDNGGGGKAAHLVVQAPHAGTYLIILRPRNLISSGTVDLYMNGQQVLSSISVEGSFLFISQAVAGETVNVLPLPLGPRMHTLYVIGDDGLHLERRTIGNPKSQWQVPNGFSGIKTLMIGTSIGDGGKPLRMVRNDVGIGGHDSDGDGLGYLLEAQTKTCARSTDSYGAFVCSSAADLRDTDSDGISDGWEVLGRDFNGVHVALPMMGANPRHKDMFLEVDYRRLTQAENAAGITRKMPGDVAVEFARTFGDFDTTDPLIALYHATQVGNPDQIKGISVHIDNGVTPTMPANATIHGDWGGYNAIDAVMNPNGVFDGQHVSELWKTNMSAARRGIFYYTPGHLPGGAQCGLGVMYCALGLDSSVLDVHEVMHSLNIDHSGPHGITPLGANCKPNYPSVANYAYTEQLSLSDGRDRPALNNTILRESGAVSPSNSAYIYDLQKIFKYIVDPATGSVDWNRNGEFSPRDQPVHAYANYAPGVGCEFTRTNQMRLPSGGDSVSVAITRIGKHTLAFHLNPKGDVSYFRSTSSFNCAAAESGCSGSSFGSVVSLTFSTPVQGIDAERVLLQGKEQIIVIAIAADGRLLERRLLLNGTTLTWTNEVAVTQNSKAEGEPSMAEHRDGKQIFLSYKGTDGLIRLRHRDADEWKKEEIILDDAGNPIAVTKEASPALVHAYLPSPKNDAALYIAFSGMTRTLHLFGLNKNGRWESMQLFDKYMTDTQGRPTLTWVPDSTGLDTPGQLYVIARAKDNIYTMMRTYFSESFNAVRIGLQSPFDSYWFGGLAIDATASPSTGVPQLWTLQTFENSKGKQLLFYPRADGIVNLKYQNYDDWNAVGWGLCNAVVNPGGTQSNPIHCPPRPY
jgi:hypothetical protein